MKQKLYINSKVDPLKIRIESYGGRDHYVIPSYTLPFNVVMNDIHYSEEQIVNSYKGLEGTLAPIGHPQDSQGNYIPATNAEAINKYHAGGWNRNVKLVGNRVFAEKWFDIEKLKQHEQGMRLIEHIEAEKPISTSVAVNIGKIPVSGKSYKYDAIIANYDHDAILLDEMPAASIEQGVGMVVNTESAIDVNNDSNILEKMYNAIKSLMPNQVGGDILNVNKEENNNMAEVTREDFDRLHESMGELLRMFKERFAKEEDRVLKVNQETDAKLDKLVGLLQANVDGATEELRIEAMRITGLPREAVDKLTEEELSVLVDRRRKEDTELRPNSANKPNERESFTKIDVSAFGGK